MQGANPLSATPSPALAGEGWGGGSSTLADGCQLSRAAGNSALIPASGESGALRVSLRSPRLESFTAEDAEPRRGSASSVGASSTSDVTGAPSFPARKSSSIARNCPTSPSNAASAKACSLRIRRSRNQVSSATGAASHPHRPSTAHASRTVSRRRRRWQARSVWVGLSVIFLSVSAANNAQLAHQTGGVKDYFLNYHFPKAGWCATNKERDRADASDDKR